MTSAVRAGTACPCQRHASNIAGPCAMEAATGRAGRCAQLSTHRHLAPIGQRQQRLHAGWGCAGGTAAANGGNLRIQNPTACVTGCVGSLIAVLPGFNNYLGPAAAAHYQLDCFSMNPAMQYCGSWHADLEAVGASRAVGGEVGGKGDLGAKARQGVAHLQRPARLRECWCSHPSQHSKGGWHLCAAGSAQQGHRHLSPVQQQLAQGLARHAGRCALDMSAQQLLPATCLVDMVGGDGAQELARAAAQQRGGQQADAGQAGRGVHVGREAEARRAAAGAAAGAAGAAPGAGAIAGLAAGAAVVGGVATEAVLAAALAVGAASSTCCGATCAALRQRRGQQGSEGQQEDGRRRGGAAVATSGGRAGHDRMGDWVCCEAPRLVHCLMQNAPGQPLSMDERAGLAE